MAATRGTLTKPQQEQVRQKIKTTQLVNRLQLFALGEKGPQGEDVVLDKDRLNAIKILLAKTLPDLRTIEHVGAGENGEIIFKTVIEQAPIQHAK